jgi:hypothetical protein
MKILTQKESLFMSKVSKIIGFAVLSTLGVSGFSGLANAATQPSAINQSIARADSNIGIGLNYTNMNYQENIKRLPADSETGFMPGFALDGSYLGSFYGLPNLYTSATYTYNSGNIAYKGSLNNGAVYNGNDNATTNRFMGRVGMAFPVSAEVALTPYINGGFQKWNRHMTGPYGYTEDYTAGLVGVGGMAQYSPAPRLVLTAKASIDAVVGGSMTPSGLPVDYGTASFQTSGEQNLSVGADYRVYRNLDLFADAKYTHFTYTGGALAFGAKEPSSQTNLMGFTTGVKYLF